jgi:prevent-host-death family protein
MSTIVLMTATVVDMSKSITQRELRNDSARVLKSVEQGEEYTVTRNGTPVARLVPLGEPDRRFVTKEQMNRGLAGMPQIDYQRMRADIEEFIDTELHDPYERHRE